MNTGTYISGLLHLLLIGWALIGGWLSMPEEEPFEVAQVSILSGEEFAALTAPPSAPRAETEAPTPTPPEPGEPAPAPAPDTPPEIAPAPEPETPAEPDPVPQPPEIAPQAEVSDAPPVAPTPPAETPGAALVTDPAPPRPSTRVAPTPAAPPPPEAEIAEEVTESATPSPDAAPEAPAEPATAPEEATTEIVTEAEEGENATLAPLASARPRARPDRPARVAEPAPEEPAAPAEPEPEAPAPDAIADALAEALGGGAQETTGVGTAPSGPPMTRGEKDALRVAVSRCWNVGSLSTEALRTSVVVAVSMQEDGKPRMETIRMISYSGGPETAASQTFESARRAIIRCGAQGYDLPVEKYDYWRDIEMTFNPEKMRIK
jgi:hypothetical protein